MHIIYDIKNKIASELVVTIIATLRWASCGPGPQDPQGCNYCNYWIGWFRILTAQVDRSTCQLRKIISQTVGPVGDSSAE